MQGERASLILCPGKMNPAGWVEPRTENECVGFGCLILILAMLLQLRENRRPDDSDKEHNDRSID